jgi:hypothetical protein
MIIELSCRVLSLSRVLSFFRRSGFSVHLAFHMYTIGNCLSISNHVFFMIIDRRSQSRNAIDEILSFNIDENVYGVLISTFSSSCRHTFLLSV